MHVGKEKTASQERHQRKANKLRSTKDLHAKLRSTQNIKRKILTTDDEFCCLHFNMC
jgi:hypothetical protein